MVKNIDQRKTLTRFRVSNHNLMIEHGRYQNIPRDERLCTVSDKNEIENEEHFLFSCDAYHNTRQNFLTPLNNTSPNHNLTVDLLNSSDSETIRIFAKFVHSCFETRNRILETRNAGN